MNVSFSQLPHSQQEGNLSLESKSLLHAGTLPTGELGALSHLDSFVSSVPHSYLSSRCSSSCLDVPFGDEVPINHHHQHHSSQPHNSHSKSQLKRLHRSQDARIRRQHRRIQKRSATRRAYRGWIKQLPHNRQTGGKGSSSRPHNPKPSYSPMLQSPSQGGLQPENSSTATSKKSSFPFCKAFRSRVQAFLKIKSDIPQNKSTPNHLRTKQSPTPTTQNTRIDSHHPHHTPQLHINNNHHDSSTSAGHSTQQATRRIWQQQHDMQCKAHRRAHWFNSHVQHHQHHGRRRHDAQLASHSKLIGGLWNVTGLLEAGKMHSIVHLMKKHNLAWLALTETHMKQQDQFIVDGYTFLTWCY